MVDLLKKNKKLMIVFAVGFVCLVLVFIISLNYYEITAENVWFSSVEALVNTISIMTFDPSVGIQDLFEAGIDRFQIILYSLLIIAVPLLTAAFFISAFIQLLYHYRLHSSKKKRTPILLFGYNSMTQAFLDSFIAYENSDQSLDRDKWCIYLITSDQIDEEEKIRYSENQIFIFSDHFLEQEQIPVRMLKKIRTSSSPKILLFYESGMKNYSIISRMETIPSDKRCTKQDMNLFIRLIQNMKRSEKSEQSLLGHVTSKIEIAPKAQILLRCEKNGIRGQIASLPQLWDLKTEKSLNYDHEGSDTEASNSNEVQDRSPLNIEMFNLNQQRAVQVVKNLIQDQKLEAEPETWNLSHLIIGYTPLTEEIICQLIQNSIISENNRITIDVLTDDSKRDLNCFISRFQLNVLHFVDEWTLTFNPEYIDGIFQFRFIQSNLFVNDVERFLNNSPTKFETIFIDSGNPEEDFQIAVRISSEIQCQKKEPTALLWMANEEISLEPYFEASHQRLQLAMDNSEKLSAELIDSFFSQIHFLPKAEDCLLFVQIINQNNQNAVKKNDTLYHEIKMEHLEPNNQEKTVRIGLNPVRWDSNLALENHRPNKDLLWQYLVGQSGISEQALLDEIFGKDGLFFEMKSMENSRAEEQSFREKKWQAASDFEKKIKNSRVLYSIGAAEHRRWAAFYLCLGYKYGECERVLQDIVMKHDCLRSFDWMLSHKVWKLPYDFSYLLDIRSQTSGKKENSEQHCSQRDNELLQPADGPTIPKDLIRNELSKRPAQNKTCPSKPYPNGTEEKLIMSEHQLFIPTLSKSDQDHPESEEEEYRIFLSYRGSSAGQEFVSELYSYLTDDPLSEELYGKIYYSPVEKPLSDFKEGLSSLLKPVKFFILPLTKGFYDGFPADPNDTERAEKSITYLEIKYAMENDTRFIAVPIDDYELTTDDINHLQILYPGNADRIITLKLGEPLQWTNKDKNFEINKSELFVRLSKELIKSKSELGSMKKRLEQQARKRNQKNGFDANNIYLDFKSALEDSSSYPFFQRIYDVKKMYLLNYASSSFISGIDVAHTYDNHNTLKSWFSYSLANGHVELSIVLTDPYSYAARDAAMYKMFPEFQKVKTEDIIPGNLNKLVQFKKNNPKANLKIYLTKIALPYVIMLTENQNPENSHMKVDLYSPVIEHDGKRPSFYMSQTDESNQEMYRFFKDNILNVMNCSFEFDGHPDTSWLKSARHEIIHKGILNTALPHTEDGFRKCIEQKYPMEIDLMMLNDGQDTIVCGRKEEEIVGQDGNVLLLEKATIMDIVQSSKVKSSDSNNPARGKKIILDDLLKMTEGEIPLILEIKTSLSSLDSRIDPEAIKDAFNGKKVEKILKSEFENYDNLMNYVDKCEQKELSLTEKEISMIEFSFNDYIEKTVKQVDKIIDSVNRYLTVFGDVFSQTYGCPGHGVAIHSSDWHVLDLVRKRNCMIPCGIISTDFSQYAKKDRTIKNEDFIEFHSNVNRLIAEQPDFISYDIQHLENGIAYKIRKICNIPLLTWTIRPNSNKDKLEQTTEYLKRKARFYQCDGWMIEK